MSSARGHRDRRPVTERHSPEDLREKIKETWVAFFGRYLGLRFYDAAESISCTNACEDSAESFAEANRPGECLASPEPAHATSGTS